MFFQFKLRRKIPFEWNKKNSVKKGYLKSQNMSEEKTTPSTNIPLLLSQKSEQSTSQKQSDKLYPFKVPYTLLPLNSFWLFFQTAQKVFLFIPNYQFQDSYCFLDSK